MVMAQAGLELPETKNRPAFQLPHLSHHNSDMRRHYTQKNTLARVVRFIFPGFQSWLQILLQHSYVTPTPHITSIKIHQIHQMHLWHPDPDSLPGPDCSDPVLKPHSVELTG